MINNKILISINNLAEVNEYKKIGITNFLFAINDFSIGYPAFSLDELKNIDGNIYLNINKIMDTKTIEKFKTIVKDLSFVKGIFFDDLGVYQVLKDTAIPLIWHQSHFVLNSASLNYWLNKTASACLSNELTIGEIKILLAKSKKPLILNVFGLNMAMYSRRYLLSAFNQTRGLKMTKEAVLKTDQGAGFIAKETTDGTVLFYQQVFNYLPFLNELNDEKILFYYFNGLNFTSQEVTALINGSYPLSEEKFLKEKTIYKLGGRA